MTDDTSAPPLDLDAIEMRARDNEDFRTYHLAQDSAADVPALLARVRDLTAKFDAAAQACDDLVAQVWRATGETHEPPADVAALLARVAWTRDRLVAGRESDATLRKAVIALTVSEAETVAKCAARVAAARREGAEAMREACADLCDARARRSVDAGAWERAADALRALPLPGGAS